MKKLFIIFSLVCLMVSCNCGKTYKCQWCNDSICEYCHCDSSFNCQDTIAWCNTCDSLFQADSAYYAEILEEMNETNK